MSDSFEKNLIETNDGESDEPDHSLGFDSQTMPSQSKKIRVMTNPNSFGSVNPELTASVNTRPESPMPSSLPPPLQRSDSMGSRIFTAIGSKLAAGSIKGSIFTMIISIVGAGCLALPYAMRNVGLIFGISLIILAAPLAYFTSDLLLISAEYLPETLRGPKPLRDISYQTLAQHSYGNWLSKALKWIMAVQYYGGHVGYLVAFSGFIDLVYSIYPHPHGWPHSIYNICVIGLGFGVTFPLGLMRTVDSLRFTSLLGFTCSSYLVLVVTIEYFVICNESSITGGAYKTTCFWSDEYHIGQKELWPMVDFETTARGFLTAFPLVVFAYTGHPFVMPLYVELARPSIRRMRKVFYRGLAIVTVLYFCISTFGFLLFLRRVCSNLLLNDFRKHIDVVIAALGISLSCILTEPIYSYNFRRMIGLIAWNKSSREISNFWHVTITFLLVASNVGLALLVSSIAVVFGFLGSTTYPLLGYILPAAFFVKMTPPGSYPIRKKVAIVQAVIVGIISLCSLAYKFYDYGDQDCDAAQNIGNR